VTKLFDRVAEVAAESSLESTSTAFAEKRGWFEVKLMRCNKDSMPDRLYHRRGVTMYVEYKREGEMPNRKQLKRHKEIRAHGIPVHVIDDFETAKLVFQ
jgi:hypothetical protein